MPVLTLDDILDTMIRYWSRKTAMSSASLNLRSGILTEADNRALRLPIINCAAIISDSNF